MERSRTMSGATTIVVAREDFSIPGAPEVTPAGPGPGGYEGRFFDLLRDSKPDVVVLDLSRANGGGVETILRIRQQSTVPLLVLCHGAPPPPAAYQLAGPADCLSPPSALPGPNQAMQQIGKV